MTIKVIARKILNKVLPKFNRVLVIGNNKGESNAIEIANYISEYYRIPVFFAVNESFKPYAKQLLTPDINLLNINSILFKFNYLTSKYILSTHSHIFPDSHKKQVRVNLWHGVGHKKIRLGRGDDGIPADITVATSDLSKEMFAEFFGVPLKSVFISGYPRNDLMLRAKKQKQILKSKIKPALDNYDKVLFWMPTYRRKSHDAKLKRDEKGMKLDNLFQVKNFNVAYFNKLLKQYNSICIVKPHYYYYLESNDLQNLSNILIIDDEWIGRQGITLYHLLACTDALITDFSSVIIDYTLLDQPVICFSTDLEEFKQNQGLYFEDIENWLPTRLIQNEDKFFKFLESILSTDEDPHAVKRKKIRDLYFLHKDAKSSERLAKHIFGHKGDKEKKDRAEM